LAQVQVQVHSDFCHQVLPFYNKQLLIMAQLNLAAPKRCVYFGLKTPVAMTMQCLMEMGGSDYVGESIGFDTWDAVKPTTPTGVLPFAEMADGTVISESGAIGRVAAAAGGFLGTGNDFAKSEMLAGMTTDLNKKVMAICPSVMNVDGFDADKKAAFAEGKPGVLEFLTKYEKQLLPAGDRFTESGTTFGEVDLFCKLNCYATGAIPEVATGGLAKFYDRMAAVPGIKAVIDGKSKFGGLGIYLCPIP